MPVRFKEKWFNPAYFIINKASKDHTIRKVFIYGGKGSTKTFSLCQFLSKEAYVNGHSSLAFRKYSARIPETLKRSFKQAQKSMRLSGGFEELDRKYNSLANDAEIGLKGMDDPEKAKGFEGYQYVYFDELNQFTYKEYEQATLSLRGKPGQKFFGAWNPVSDTSWLKTDVIDQYTWHDTDKFGTLPCPNSFVRLSHCGTMLLIKTTWEDNKWIAGAPDGDNGVNNEYGYRDEALIADYKALEKSNPNSFKVNVLGEWGKSVYGGEFLKDWKTNIHTGEYKYNPERALYLFFDENTVPYFPCLFMQTEKIDGVEHLFIIHEIAAKSPDNKVKKMGPMIWRKIREWDHKGIIFVGGDATSQKEDVKQEKGHDLFKLIMGELQEYHDVRRYTDASNPSVILSGQFTNAVLEGEFEKIRVRVDKSCRTTINDFENTKEDKNGKVDKSTVEDPETGQRYQPWGHCCDILRYALVKLFPDKYKKFASGGYVTTETHGTMKKKGRW